MCVCECVRACACACACVWRVTEVGYGHPVQYAQCVRCWKTFRGPQAHTELMRTPCTGNVAQRIVRPSPVSWYINVKGHHLWRSGPYVWCARCGCHSSQRAVGLKDDCKPRTERQSRELCNLRAGRKPRGAASEGRQYWPERLTVAGWLEFTGAPLGPDVAAAAVEEEQLDEQQVEEQWQVGPVQGALARCSFSRERLCPREAALGAAWSRGGRSCEWPLPRGARARLRSTVVKELGRMGCGLVPRWPLQEWLLPRGACARLHSTVVLGSSGWGVTRA